jgi:Mg2+ and Co2+ transporter CorA
MDEIIIQLINSYESRIKMVEDIFVAASDVTSKFERTLTEIEDDRESATQSLQEILSKNCSLRRKDFNSFMEKLLAEHEEEKKLVKEEMNVTHDILNKYLNEQRQLATSLRDVLKRFSEGDAKKDEVEQAVLQIRSAYQQKGMEIFSYLRRSQVHIENFHREAAMINHKLKALAERGKNLRFEELRKIDAYAEQEKRKAERQACKDEIEKLLESFRYNRKNQ